MTKLFNKMAQMFVTIFSFASAEGMEMNYTTLSDEKFYQLHSTESQCVVEDNALKQQPDITHHKFDCKANQNEPLLTEYARRRIKFKKDNGVYPELTDQDVQFLQSEPDFLQAFRAFLQNWSVTNFYSELATRAVELSRSAPTTEYPNGRPMIDPKIRSENQTYVRELDTKHSALYEPLGKYMEHISKTHARTPFQIWKQQQN